MGYEISKHTGELTQIRREGRALLAGPMKLTAWRAPVDNERDIAGKWGHPNIWEGENLDRTFNNVRSVSARENGVAVTGAVAGVGRAPFLRYTLTFTACPADGSMWTSGPRSGKTASGSSGWAWSLP